jgi:hypothetical protein
MNKFNIMSITDRDDEYGLSYTYVTVTMLSKDWLAIKRRGGLGMLYGVDICNVLYREHGIPAINPTVDDAWRGKRGIKTIRLTFYRKAKPQLKLVHSA